MPCAAPRVWWLYGAPCAGKSVTAWELFTHVLAGQPRAYFDVDQVGMCYPEDERDPGGYALKARAAGVLLRRLTAAGACTVIVSGVLDQRSLRAVAEEADGAAVTFCRIRVEPGELTRRLTARYDPDVVVRVLAEAREWDQLATGRPVVDTGNGTPLAAAHRARQLLEEAAPEPTAAARSQRAATPVRAPASKPGSPC